MSASKLLLPGCLCVMGSRTGMYSTLRNPQRLCTLEKGDITLMINITVATASITSVNVGLALTGIRSGFISVVYEEVVR